MSRKPLGFASPRRTRRRAACATLSAALTLALGTALPAFGQQVPADHAAQMSRSMELFKAQVRALLKQHCLECHGGETTQAEFDLSTREGLLKGGEHGAAVVSGKPAESLLVKLIRHEGEPHMPEGGEKLPDAAIAAISDWIASGAAYDAPLVDAAEAFTARTVGPEARQFWSFQPLSQPAIPAVRDESWRRSPIDNFVLARLESSNLKPNNPASRRKLIRRAYFDLIGLPPEAEEVEKFVNDPASDAYDRLIDRLLNSPHYGERWGRHWLDLARFAESHGYEQDYDRPSAYHYRDFVIQALNQDMPYDQFVRWQLAGDEFAPNDNLALMATGFLGAGTHATQITANQVEKERYDELDDMAATVGTAMLGLTIGCARCHDHKFDPIPQADYYRLVSTFTTTVRSEIELDFQPERTRAAKEAFDREHAPLAEALASFERDELPSRLEAWLTADSSGPAPTWLIVEPAAITSAAGAKFERQDDGSYLVSGKNAAHDTYTFEIQAPPRRLTGIRLEAMAHDSLPKHGPGRAGNGNFALTDVQLWSNLPGEAAPDQRVKLVNTRATFEQKGLPIAATIDDDAKSGWAVDPQFGKDHAATFEPETPLELPPDATLRIMLKFDNNAQHNLGRVRLALSTAEKIELAGDAASLKQYDQMLRDRATPAAERTEEQRARLLAWYRERDPRWRELHGAVQAHLQQAPQPELTKVMVTSEGLPAIRLHTQGGDFFEKTFFLRRGDLSQKIGEASQSFLQVLMSTPDGERRWQEPAPEGWRTSYRRRALANWITDTEAGAGHLLARVMANRLWQHHLGRGLVATSSDFGASGERPTHPELLDYLAGQLIDGGWRLKQLHKQIMTSAVYMQNTATDSERAALDPDNRLLWHWPRQRLEAEPIRDAMLAASGLLDTRMYGPGSLDESQRRRSIYFMIKRSQLIPSMMLYDAPDSLQGLGQRAATIVAPQALAMLNNKQVHEYSRAMAKRVLAQESSPEGRIQRGYLLALGRPADEAELADSLAFLKQTGEVYRAAGTNDADETALADFCQVLFGLNEFIYID